jgi:hypothetical protein
MGESRSGPRIGKRDPEPDFQERGWPRVPLPRVVGPEWPRGSIRQGPQQLREQLFVRGHYHETSRERGPARSAERAWLSFRSV